MSIENEITDNSPLWWEIQNIPTEIVRELRRRSNTNNIGMESPFPFQNIVLDFENSYSKYKGPLSPWVRIFSNSTGKSVNGLVPGSAYLLKNEKQFDYDGFILSGGEGFYDAYGYTNGKQFGSSDSKPAILGYQANGQPHFIDNKYRSQLMYETPLNSKFPQNSQSPSILPPPSITSVNIKQGKEYITYGKFNFKCFGLAQLEYLTPFFLTPYINIFIEFGWNLFNQKSLLNLNSIPECLNVIEKPQTVIDRSILSNGNYGCITGIITKYNITTQDGFVYDCMVETTSRQGLYSGMRTDNNVKIDLKTRDNNEYLDFMSLKTFVKTYFPKIKDVLESERTPPNNITGPSTFDDLRNNPGNFLNYILKQSKPNPQTKENKDANAAAEDLKNSNQTIKGPTANGTNVPNEAQTFQNLNQTIDQIKGTSTLFYNGESEDRVFTGRLQSIYKKSKIPNGGEDVIQYGKVNNNKTQISFANEFDFDAKESENEFWFQLDFVFEAMNLFMANLKTNQYLIDISQVIINAHPNLISCDKNVLIGNPVSPKINIGRAVYPGGFLKPEDYNTDNPFLTQESDIFIGRNETFDDMLKKNLIDFYSLTDEQSFYLACEAARKTFKTLNRSRDDLDTLINYLYYDINKREPIKESAAFPFRNDKEVTRKGKDGIPIKVIYKKYYYGYLKHIYISKKALIDIAESDLTNNYKEFINSILNVVNEAFDNFWKLEIQEGVDDFGRSILSIIDKNTINYEALKQIYTFELAKTNNVIRNFNFDASLSNEQANQIRFGTPNSENFTREILNNITTDPVATLNVIENTPVLKFVDRLDKEQLRKLAESLSKSLDATLTPGTASGLTDENNDIRDLQKYGDKRKDGVLMMTVKNIQDINLIQPSTPKTRADVATAGTPNRNPPSGTPSPPGSRAAAAAAAGMRGNFNSSNPSPPGSRAAAAAAAGQRGNPVVKPAIKKGYSDEQLKQIADDELNRKNYKYLCLPSSLKGKLRQMLDDGDFKNNTAKYSGIADNFTVTLTFDGIFALRNLQCFAIRNLPKPYVPGNVVFQVLEVEHNIVAGSWKTEVTALVRCQGTSRLEYIIV